MWEKGENSHFGHLQPFCSCCKPLIAPQENACYVCDKSYLHHDTTCVFEKHLFHGWNSLPLSLLFPFSLKPSLLLHFFILLYAFYDALQFFFLIIVEKSPAVSTELVTPFWLKGFIKNYSRLCQPTLTKMAFDFISVQMLTSACGFLAFIGCDINIHTVILASICFPFCTKWRIE